MGDVAGARRGCAQVGGCVLGKALVNCAFTSKSSLDSALSSLSNLLTLGLTNAVDTDVST